MKQLKQTRQIRIIPTEHPNQNKPNKSTSNSSRWTTFTPKFPTTPINQPCSITCYRVSSAEDSLRYFTRGVCVITRVLIIGSWQFLPFGETFVYVRLSFTALMAHTCSVTIFVDFPTHLNGEENWGFVFIFCQSDVSDKMFQGWFFGNINFSWKNNSEWRFHAFARYLPIDWPPKATLQQPKLQRMPAAKCLPLFCLMIQTTCGLIWQRADATQFVSVRSIVVRFLFTTHYCTRVEPSLTCVCVIKVLDCRKCIF